MSEIYDVIILGAGPAGLAAGLNVVWGHVTYRAVATALQLPYLPWQEAGLDA